MTVAQVELEHLLTYVGSWRCECYLNGSWYAAEEAQAHLREKLGLLNGNNRIGSAEKFIELVATSNASTKLACQVRHGGAAADLDGWLRQGVATLQMRRRRLPRHPSSPLALGAVPHRRGMDGAAH